MNIKQIRYFLAVAEHKSFSKAAEKINIAQPALSLQIKILEEKLAAKLLNRHARGVTLTDTGQVVFKHFQKIAQDIDDTRNLVSDHMSDPAGDVHIGITTTAARALVTLLVARCKKKYPKITLHLLEAMSGTLYDSLNKGKLDMAILYNFDRYDRVKNLYDTPIALEKLHLIGKDINSFNGFAGGIDFKNIKDFPLAIPSHPHTLNILLSEMSLRQGVEINMAAEINSFTGMIELSKAGYYTVSPMVSIKEEIKRGELYAVPIINPELQWSIHLVAKEEVPKSQAANAIHSLITETIISLIKEGKWQAEMV